MTNIEPGSPYHPHTRECESGYRYGPWTDCGCLERLTDDMRGVCEDCADHDHCRMCDCCCEPGTP